MAEGLLVLRLWLGVVFVVHAAPKLVPPVAVPGWVAAVFGADYAGSLGEGRRSAAEAFARLAVPAPGPAALAAGVSQLAGAILVAIGPGARVGAALLVANMIGAVVAKRRNGLVGPKGYEYPLTLLVCALAVLLAGPGAHVVRLG